MEARDIGFQPPGPLPFGMDGGRLRSRTEGVIESAVEPVGIQPRDPGERGELHVVGSPRSLLSDDLGLVVTVDGLG